MKLLILLVLYSELLADLPAYDSFVLFQVISVHLAALQAHEQPAVQSEYLRA
jgi:hypothetical protein